MSSQALVFITDFIMPLTVFSIWWVLLGARKDGRHGYSICIGFGLGFIMELQFNIQFMALFATTRRPSWSNLKFDHSAQFAAPVAICSRHVLQNRYEPLGVNGWMAHVLWVCFVAHRFARRIAKRIFLVGSTW
jgi:hypothetical protein